MTKEDRKYFDRKFDEVHKRLDEQLELMFKRTELEHDHFTEIIDVMSKTFFKGLKTIAEAM